MKKQFCILAFCLSVTACIYPYTPELDQAPEGILAVDANITIGAVSTVRLGTLYSLYPSSEGYQYPDFSNARVWLEDDAGGNYPGNLHRPSYDPYSNPEAYLGSAYDIIYAGYGSYYDPSNPTYYIDTQNAPRDRRYRLFIEALDGLFTSDWSDLGEPPAITDIQFLADDEYVTVGVSLDGGPDATGYALLSYEETWLFHVDYIPSFTVTPVGTDGVQVQETGPDASKYWCWRSVDNRRTFPVDYTSMTTDGVTNWPLQKFLRSDNRNHRRYSVNVTARTISKSTYRFLKNLEDTSSGGDNLFTPTPGEIAGNLHCDSDPDRMVLGYVLFSTSVSKRGWMDNRYLKGRPNYYNLLWFTEDKYRMYYESGWTVLSQVEVPKEGEGKYGWGPQSCYDCTAAGGTLTRPDFWEE